MALKHRLKKLGLYARAEQPCPDCDEYPVPPAPGDEIEVTWIDDEKDPRYGEEPTICPTCGEPDFIVIKWLDLDED
jgi:hypothetical protein